MKVTFSLSGRLFRDLNSNGVQDPGEPNLAGGVVELDAGTLGNVVGTAVSDANGNYAFTGLGQGTFIVTQRRVAGVILTTPAEGSYTVTATSGGSVSGLNFGSATFDLIATGSDNGGGPNVMVFNAASDALRFNFF